MGSGICSSSSERGTCGLVSDTAPPLHNSPRARLFDRPWEIISPMNTDDKFSFTMMTFNILADGLCGTWEVDDSQEPKQFLGVPRHVLSWEFRGPKIVEEIKRVDPDVLCIQECDHIDFFSDELGSVYNHVFKRKKWSPCLDIRPKADADGVAIFFKKDKFEMTNSIHTKQNRHKKFVRNVLQQDDLKTSDMIEFDVLKERLKQWRSEKGLPDRVIECYREDLSLSEDVTQTSIVALQTWFEKDNFPVSVAVRLRPRHTTDTTSDLVILTTHLSASKTEEGEVERRRELEHLLRNDELIALMDGGAHLFIGADLNSVSYNSKGYFPRVYTYAVGSPDGGFASEAEAKEWDVLEKPFSSAMRRDQHELKYSTWKFRERDDQMIEDQHTIDYLLYDSSEWAVGKVLSVPSEDVVQRERRRAKAEWKLSELPSALPSLKYPSDHFALAVEFIKS